MAVLPFGTDERTVALRWSEAVTCPHCGRRSNARVLGVGHGGGEASQSLWSLTREGSSPERQARSNAHRAGRTALKRARCPSCGKRAGGLVSLWIGTLFFWTVVAAACWFSEEEGGLPAWWHQVVPALGLVAALVGTPLTIRWKLRQADERVLFEPLPPPAPAPRLPPVPGPIPDYAAPPDPPAQSPFARPPRPGDPGSGLELDVDWSWNKKG